MASKSYLSNKHLWFAFIAIYYFVNSWYNNSIDFGTSLAIVCVPFIYHSLTKFSPVNKNIIRLISIPSLIILLVFTIYVFLNAFPFPNNETSRPPVYFLQMLFTQKTYSAGLIWRNTDVVNYLLISFPFLIVSWKNRRLLIIPFILLFLVAVYTTKALAIIVALLFIGCHSLKVEHHKYVARSLIFFLIMYPFIISSEYILNLLANKTTNLILNGRGTIWLEAIKLWSENIVSLLFGIGDKPLIIKNFFSEGYSQISYHSGFLRLLVQNGIIFYYLAIGSLFYLFINSYRASTVIIKKLIIALLSSLIALNLTDGSLFYSFGFFLPIILPLSLLFNIDQRLIRVSNINFSHNQYLINK